MNCTHCSAKIPSEALTCPYCSHETPNFAKARAREEEAKRHAQQLSMIDASKARASGIAALEGTARNAFYWSMAGVPICCVPASIVGLMMALRVRKSAAALNVAAPWKSMAALVISAVTLAMFLLFTVFVVVTEREKSARVAVLREATKSGVTAAQLDVETACGLVEMTLLEGGAGQKGGLLEVFRCAGAIEQTPEGGAVLKDVEYSRTSADAPERVDACLSKGSRWKVDRIGTGPGCQAGLDGGE